MLITTKVILAGVDQDKSNYCRCCSTWKCSLHMLMRAKVIIVCVVEHGSVFFLHLLIKTKVNLVFFDQDKSVSCMTRKKWSVYALLNAIVFFLNVLIKKKWFFHVLIKTKVFLIRVRSTRNCFFACIDQEKSYFCMCWSRQVFLACLDQDKGVSCMCWLRQKCFFHMLIKTKVTLVGVDQHGVGCVWWQRLSRSLPIAHRQDSR